MLKYVQIMLIRALMLLCVVIFLDSCKLFRRKENTTTTSSGKYPPKNTPVKKSYSSKTINEVVSLARSYTGVPYRAGGVDANGMDCSGLLYCVYGQLGFQIPRISWQQSEVGREISVDELKVGDWVFFVTNKGGTGSINHAGISTETPKKYSSYTPPLPKVSEKIIYSASIGWAVLPKPCVLFKII
jgi:probable lipoprotein NlpC